MAAESILPRFTEREWGPIGELLCLQENRHDIAEGCIQEAYTFVLDGEAQTRTAFHWVYTVREIRHMLEEADLATVGLYRSYDRDPFEMGSPILILVAERE